jgi:hypothetical protein
MRRRFGKTAAALMGGVSLALGGCATMKTGPVRQVLYCQPGYYLASDALCWPVAQPSTGNNDVAAGNDDPAIPTPPPEPHGWHWGHDITTAGGGAVIGALAGNQFAQRRAAGELAAAEERAAAQRAAALAAEREAEKRAAELAARNAARVVPRLAAPLAEEDALGIWIERAFVWVVEHPYILLESDKSNAPDHWRSLIRNPVYVAK